MKYVILIIDGASGWPAGALGGRTSLEAARLPNLDRLAREGALGVVENVPPGMEPSSAIACMSVMGFDPAAYYAGRGPIEAMAMGVELEPGQVAMRCNLVTVVDGLMVSYSAGNISSGEAAELVEALREGLRDLLNERMELRAGVSFRNILTVREGAALLETRFTPPHDIADKPVAPALPVGPAAGLALELMERSKPVLAGHPVNEARVERGQPPATQIWLFWPGMKPADVPSFAERYGGRSAALTTGVDLLRGLALQTGVEVLHLPGVTDAGDNDYSGQMEGALAALSDHDVVFVHVEAPDEAGHAGDVAGKVRALEQVDALMVPQVLALADKGARGGGSVGPGVGEGGGAGPRAGENGGMRLLVLADHPTPVEIKTHVAEAVPFLMWGPGFSPNGAQAYTEAEARATGFAVAPGHKLMGMFLGNGSG